MSGFAVVVLDLDDTLFDHRGAAASGCRTWCSELGLAATGLDEQTDRWLALEAEAFEEYRSGRCSFQDQRRVRVRQFLPGALDWDDGRADEAFEGYLQHYRAHWRTFPDVEPALVALRDRGQRVAVLTNGDQAQQEEKLAMIGIDALIDEVFASSRLPAAKPEHECYAAVAEALDVAPGECVMVGDDLAKDVDAARAAGWGAVWLDREGHVVTPHEEGGPPVVRDSSRLVIASLTDLLRGAQTGPALA